MDTLSRSYLIIFILLLAVTTGFSQGNNMRVNTLTATTGITNNGIYKQTSGSLGAGKVMTDVAGNGIGTWETSAAGNLTPWTSDINAARFSLTNFNQISSPQTNAFAGFTIGNTADRQILMIDSLDAHSNAAPFYAYGVGLNWAQFSGQSNQVITLWGYNDNGSVRAKTNESAYQDTFESSWDPGANDVYRQQEKYVTYTSPAGQSLRLDQALHRWSIAGRTNVLTQRDFAYQIFNFIGLSNNLAWCTFQQGENNGDYGAISLDGRLTTSSNVANLGGMTIQHGGDLTIYNRFQNKAAQFYYPSSNFFTIADVTSAQTNRFQDWKEVEFRTDFANTKIAVKAGTAQTDNLQEWRNNSGNMLSGIMSNGWITGATDADMFSSGTVNIDSALRVGANSSTGPILSLGPSGSSTYLIEGSGQLKHVMSSGWTFGWASSGAAAPTTLRGNLDTAMKRNAAGVIELNNGTAGSRVDLLSRSITTTNLFSGALFLSRFATNANVTMTTNFFTWAITSVAVLVTNTLPTAAQCTGLHVVIKDEGGNAAATNLAIIPVSGDRIDGATSLAINSNYGFKRLYSAGSTNWFTE